MTRTIEINPVTRIEGHAKVHIEVADDGKVEAAYMHVLEYRGFEKIVEGMQVELMPTLTSRICGTCPHAHHLVASKTLDRVFSVEPPRAAVMLRELLNCGSYLHSHGVHFFALAGPDLLLGLDAPAAKRNIMGLLEAAPELATKALRLRSIGQKIAEIVGGRGTHPITCVAGGMSSPISAEQHDTLKRLTAEALELTKVALAAGKDALAKKESLLNILPLPVYNMGTVKNGNLDLFDGAIRVQRADGSVALEFDAADYAKHIFEEALPYTYSKQVFFKDPGGEPAAYRVGPLARINCADAIDTPLANAELQEFQSKWGKPCKLTVLNHLARLIEMMYVAEKAVALVADDEIASPEVRTQPTAKPRSAIAHVEAPRGVLIHDYTVDGEGIVQKANFIVATQHNISSINASVKAAARQFWGKPDDELLNGIEFAIRCYDPCLSCSTHQIGRMPLDVTITRSGRVERRVGRS
jgi:F420-non-reducing hydrogenase large subunit